LSELPQLSHKLEPFEALGSLFGEQFSTKESHEAPRESLRLQSTSAAMNTHSTVFDDASSKATMSDQTLQIVLAAWRQGNFVEVVNQFNDQFTFTDHALGLEFTDKAHLSEFLAKIRERFPDSERRDYTTFDVGDHFISEWTLTATQTESFIGGRLRRIPIRVQGVSVVQIKNGKISRWSDYYDELKARRYGVAALFTEWIEI
jgi:steroid delta-isomerase-like uncharacterized protein